MDEFNYTDKRESEYISVIKSCACMQDVDCSCYGKEEEKEAKKVQVGILRMGRCFLIERMALQYH